MSQNNVPNTTKPRATINFFICEISGFHGGEYGMYCRVFKSMSTDVSEVRAASIIRDIDFKTRQYIPEDSELQLLLSIEIENSLL
jgi:hypothetical protein